MSAAEELAELRGAVLGVRQALTDLRANGDPSRASMLKVNARDARDSLRRRVNQISPETLSRQVRNTVKKDSETLSRQVRNTVKTGHPPPFAYARPSLPLCLSRPL